jgi:hypothetical protein
MMKFFRKYNKHLLAIFMVLLMVVFVGGSALQSLLEPTRNVVVAHSRLGDISLLDQQRAQNSTVILRALGLNWQWLSGSGAQPLTLTDWILLTREAEEYQAKARPAAARTWLGDDLGPDQIDLIARTLEVKPSRIYQAVGEFLSIQEAARAVAAVSVPSSAEIRATARDALDKVKIQAVVLPGKAFVDEEATFTENELRTQLETYREKEAGEGLNFGYYVDPAVKLQFLRIRRDKIAEAIGVPNLEREAKAYYDEHPTNPEFRRPPDEETAPPTDPSTVEGPPEEKPPYLEWEEAKETAMDIIRKQHADEQAGRIARWLVEHTTEPWLAVSRGEDGYKVAPEGITRESYYDDVIKRIPATIRYPDSVDTSQTSFFSEEEAHEVPLLGSASAPASRAGTLGSLRTLAFKSEPIVPEIPKEEGVSMDDYLAMFQTGPYPLVDTTGTGDVYVFRIIDARPGHPAESVDEVRERLTKDLRLRRGYEAAENRAETIRAAACEHGLRTGYENDAELQALAESAAETGLGFFEPFPFPRVPPYEVAQGRQRGWTYVMDLGKLSDSDVDECFSLEEAEDKLTLLSLPDQATIMVVEWVETQRGREDEFEEMKKTLVPQLVGARQREVREEWLDPEQIRARNRWEAAGSGG